MWYQAIMSSMSPREKRVLERLFEMDGGYVLDFSNRTFAELFVDTVGVEIYDPQYEYGSGSKANLLRGFWTNQPDHLVARVLADLVEYAAEKNADAELLEKAMAIVERLRLAAPVPELAALTPNEPGRDFELLAETVREAIEGDKPEAGLDRLHTFVVRYVRVLCQREGIDIGRDKPLHSLFGELRKNLLQRGAIESQMADRILKSTISLLDSFNEVRNNRSLAHDNRLLKYREALFIFNSVANTIRFLESIEAPKLTDACEDEEQEDIPF